MTNILFNVLVSVLISTHLIGNVSAQGSRALRGNPQTELNPHANDWCPFARCEASTMCEPCNRRFLFIVSMGRSGSTTLMNMFDDLPGVRLSGENWGLMNKFYEIGQSLQFLYRHESGPTAKKHYDMPNAQSLACSYQHFTAAINPPHKEILESYDSYQEDDVPTIIGFKTVRLHFLDSTPEKVANFFMRNFPCSRVIVNIRNDFDNILESRRTASFEPYMRNEAGIESELQFLTAFAKEMGPERSKLLNMGEWTNDVSVLNDAVNWLGFEGCAFTSIKHDNNGRYRLDWKYEPNLGENCHYPV